MSTPLTARSAVELEVGRIAELLGRHAYREALAAAAALRVQVPENRDVLLLHATSQRLLGDLPGALATLDSLGTLHPQFSRLFEERGECQLAAGRAAEAITAFERAVHGNAALVHSWSRLEALYRLAGAEAPAAHAAAQVLALQRLPRELLAANVLFGDGECGAAAQRVRTFVARHGPHVEALYLLARIAVAADEPEAARQLFDALLEHAPQHRAARWEFAQLLLERHRYAPALAEAEHLLSAEPDHRGYRLLQARCYAGLGRHEQALACYRELLPGAAQPAELQLAIGHELKALGRAALAAEAYRAALAARADCGDAYWSLANLKTCRFEDRELTAMRAAESAAINDADRYALCFALGAALEARAEYAASFEYYARGNALRHAAGHYDGESLARERQALITICSPELFARHQGGGVPARDPIFIVGLPRSGSTLVEQILASHSAVEGTHELADVPRLASELGGREASPDAPRYPEVVAQLSAPQLRDIGAQYLEDTRPYRGGKPRFIDKMPNNFRHVGLIHLMLPNAVIIDVRREPLACCFAIFKQLFARGHDFAYDLGDIARYYRGYLELMRHWDRVLPGRVLRVHYEDLVADLEGSVRRLLSHCGLDFEPDCLAFHRSARSVATASAEQVRRPLYRDGLEQWRHYEPWLGALHEALGDAPERFRD